MENNVNGFLRTKGQKLINGEEREVLLRGVGLGGWLLPEGYMWCFPEHVDRPRRIEQMIKDLIGEEKSKRFWETYYECYITEADIRQIAFEEFNSVRVPISSRFILEGRDSGKYNEHHLQLIDRLIEWCTTHRLYVILDLHGAPGGQTGANIDDSEHDRPELFMNEENKHLTIALWRMLAERYKDEWIVAGYDLLNEPLPEWFSRYNGHVMPLYREIAKAIRKVDKLHIIILEGVHWATDWSIFTEKIDNNIVLEFHKYWNNPDTESIQSYLNKREEWNVPIFMGEGGENNCDWYTGAFRLFEDHNISWNFWTWKKMNTNNSPCSIKMPVEWCRLVDYLKGGVKPDEKTVERILQEYLYNILFDRCMYHQQVVRSIFRRPPIRIPAIFYGYRGKGVSFGIMHRTDRQIRFRINDCTDILFIKDGKSVPNFKHSQGEPWRTDEQLCVRLAQGDWLAYEFEVFSKGSFFTIDLHMYALDEKGEVIVSVDDIAVWTAEVKVELWKTTYLKRTFWLNPGLHRIIIRARGSSVCVQWLEIMPCA